MVPQKKGCSSIGNGMVSQLNDMETFLFVDSEVKLHEKVSGTASDPVSFKFDMWKHFRYPKSKNEKEAQVTDGQKH